MILVIILVTAIVSFFAFSNRELFDRLKFNAWYIKHDREWYRFISYALLHADWGHLLINMFVLWSFSGVVMQIFTRDFGQMANFYLLMLYIGGLIFATLWDFAKNKDNIYYNAVGASGAVAAVVFSSIILYPDGRIFFFFIPVGIPSWLFGILYLAYSAYMGKRNQDNIGHNAHFWGAIFGIVFTLLIHPDYLTLFYKQLGF
ncbi:MAG: rhomboid family intramembrane serine protease [Bacteroidales bacterium]|nr:rhomboid family intramembrane serine protease [Bacteroidales bacterium]